MKGFVHLHAHSHYSLLQALPTIETLVEAAVKDGASALALTDLGNLYGAIEFYKQCKEKNIKPIIGVEAYVAVRTRTDKEARIDNRRFRLLLLSKNIEGYKNLVKLVTAANLEGFYYKPRIDRELLGQYGSGLIAIFPALWGEVALTLSSHEALRAAGVVTDYQALLGKENIFLEITHHPEIEGHTERMRQIQKISKETGAPLVAANEVYYIHKDDKRARDIELKIQSGMEPGEENGFSPKEDFSFHSAEDIAKNFKDIPEALENAKKIGELCDLTLDLGKWVFPKIELEHKKNYDEELRYLSYKGIGERGLTETDEIKNRIEYELGIIAGKGFSPYFLVVADLLRFAREKHILTTTRGSAAGSVVSYLTGITTINPLEYKLPFERFLNPERPKAPDIDMDFADNKRDEVIEYAKKKYGEDHVAQIGTFGTMMARGAVRDIARALGHPYGVGDKIARLIPFGSQGFPMTIDHAMETTPDLAALYKSDATVREVMDFAKKIEGCARHISVHAAGVVIAPEPLSEFVPLQLDPKGGKLITQYDMHGIEDIGLLKFDFLGIKNLAILSDAVARANKTYNLSIDIEKIPLDDAKTFSMLTRGETMGLFQLNGSGMTRHLKDLKPSTIYDINAMVALYRPGPMESIPSYIERKHNPHLVVYLDPRLEEILAQSYGVITYQDDVLLIAVKLAGYSWLEADALRKAMGKKIPAEMEAQREKLTEGLMKNGMPSERARVLWKLIEPFAAYGFNKAHAASYGKVAYQTAYMKANFPLEYMAAVLTADAGDVDKVAEAIGECVRMGIPVLPPNINESSGDFAVRDSENGKKVIRFGLYSIKNLGEGIAAAIIEEREMKGKFLSLEDFLHRIQHKNLNRKSLESLIKCGAMDALGERGAMIGNIEELLDYSKESSRQSKDQSSLFSVETRNTLTLKGAGAASSDEKLAWEKELLGLYISGHPLDKFKDKLSAHKTTIAYIKAELKEGMPAVVYGVVEDARPVMTKNGGMMAFAKVADLTGTIEIVIFPKLFEEHKDKLQKEKCIGVRGRVSNRNGEYSIVADALKELT